MRILGLCAIGLAASFHLAAVGAEPKPPVSPGSFKAGFAERDITPEVGMEMPGNYGKVFGRSIHDPCKVRAAVFDDGLKRVALVGVDALMLRRENVQAARRRIQERRCIPADAGTIG